MLARRALASCTDRGLDGMGIVAMSATGPQTIKAVRDVVWSSAPAVIIEGPAVCADFYHMENE